jgi:hypothetical protein
VHVRTAIRECIVDQATADAIDKLIAEWPPLSDKKKKELARVLESPGSITGELLSDYSPLSDEQKRIFRKSKKVTRPILLEIINASPWSCEWNGAGYSLRHPSGGDLFLFDTGFKLHFTAFWQEGDKLRGHETDYQTAAEILLGCPGE